MSEVPQIQYGGSPDGIRTIIGIQPPLNDEQIAAVEGLVIDYLSQESRGVFLGATAIIERTPDSGDPYSEFQLEPLRLDDSRSEHFGNSWIPGLLMKVAETIANSIDTEESVAVTVNHQQLGAGACLFDGEMNVWYREGLDRELPIQQTVC